MPSQDVSVIGATYKSKDQGKTIKAGPGEVFVRDNKTGTVLRRPADDVSGRKSVSSQQAKQVKQKVEKSGQQGQSLLEKQQQEQQQAIEDLRNRLGQQQSPMEMQQQMEQDRGVPEIQQRTKGIRSRINELETILSDLPEDVQSRTEGALLTEAQRNRLLTKEQQPLMENIETSARELGVESQNLSEARQGIAQMVQNMMANQDRLLEPDRMKISQLSEQAAREMSQFNQQQEAELDAILDDISRQRQLSDAEWQRANQLADQATQFRRGLQEMQEAARIEENRLSLQDQLARGRNVQKAGLAQQSDILNANLKDTQGEREVDNLAKISDQVNEIFQPKAQPRSTGGLRALGIPGVTNITGSSFLDRLAGREPEPEPQNVTIDQYNQALDLATKNDVSPGTFHERYSHMLSPEDQSRLRIPTLSQVGGSAGGGIPGFENL